MRPAYPLLRAILLVVALAVCVATLRSRVASANDDKEAKKELKAQAEALLAKSKDLSNIEAPGSPAFVLDAKIHYQLGTQSADGQGQIIWLAPDHYREAYTAPNYSYTEIVRDGYRYLARTNDEMPLVMYELHLAIGRAIHGNPYWKAKVKNIKLTQSGNEPLTCVTLEPSPAVEQCLDSEGNVIRSETVSSPTPTPTSHRYEFGKFAAFDTKSFPEKIVLRGGDDRLIEIDVQQLALMKGEAPADAFAIPTGAVKETWCAEPKFYRDPMNSVMFSTDLLTSIGGARPSFYWVIGPNGRPREATVIHSSRPISDKDMRALMKSTQFDSLRCDHDGIEYQTETSPIH